MAVAIDLSIRADILSLPLALMVSSGQRILTTSSSVLKRPGMPFGVVTSLGVSCRGVTVLSKQLLKNELRASALSRSVSYIGGVVVCQNWD